MSDLVTVTLNGTRYQVPRGILAIEALKQAAHVEVAHFCYHPKLRPVGMCRMCVVEIGMPRLGPDRKPVLKPDGTPEIAFMPKPQTACNFPVSDGMVINSETPEVKKAVAGVVEFFLANHPLDCPVCDKGGECPLQDQTFQVGHGLSRVAEMWGGDVRLHQGIYQLKRHFEKPAPLGDLIMLDRERCIQCGRCVRFQEDIAHEHVLAFDARGSKTEIVSYSDPVFDSRYSGNTVDICPVGALTSRVFRFQARVWELHHTPSTCNQCGCGCNIDLCHRTNHLSRIIPRDNEAINEVWLCDRGRFGHEFVSHPDRITEPHVRKDGRLQPVSWEEALQTIAARVQEIKAKHGAGAIGGIASPKLPLEDNHVFVRFLREAVGTDHLDYRTDPRVSHELRQAPDLFEQVEHADVLLLIECDPLEEAPILDLRIKKAISQRGAKLITINPRRIALDTLAAHSLAYGSGHAVGVLNDLTASLLKRGLPREGTATAGLDALRSSLNGSSPPAGDVAAGALEAAAEALSGSSRLVVLLGERTGSATRVSARNVAKLAGRGEASYVLANEANSLGMLAVGCLPRNGGRDLAGMVGGAGELKALFVLSRDLVSSHPQSNAVTRMLEGLELLVVHDLFMTETARRADVLLPGLTFAEKDGRLMSMTGVVQNMRAALKPPASCRPEWQVYQSLASHLGVEFSYRSSAEIVKALGTFEGMGTAVEPALQAAPRTNGAQPVEAGSFTLITGPELLDAGQTVTRNEHLAKRIRPAIAEVNRDDARALGVKSGDAIKITSSRGSITLPVKLSRNVVAGTVFVPERQPGAKVNELIDLAHGVQRVRLEAAGG